MDPTTVIGKAPATDDPLAWIAMMLVAVVVSVLVWQLRQVEVDKIVWIYGSRLRPDATVGGLAGFRLRKVDVKVDIHIDRSGNIEFRKRLGGRGRSKRLRHEFRRGRKRAARNAALGDGLQFVGQAGRRMGHGMQQQQIPECGKVQRLALGV